MKTSHAKESLEKFHHDLNEFNENLTLAQESSEEMVSFIDLHVKLLEIELCIMQLVTILKG